MTTSRAVLLKGVADVAARGTALITFPILAAHVGAAGYGAYGQVSTIVGLVVPFASLGIGSAMVRFFAARAWTPVTARQIARIGTIVIGLAVIPTALMALFAEQLNDLFLGYPDGGDLFLWGSLLVLLGAAEVWVLDLLRSRDWLFQYSLIQLSQSVLLVGAVAILLPNGYGIVALVQATAAIKALALIGAVATAVRHARYEEPPKDANESAPRLSAMIRYGLPLTVAGFGLWMVNLSDRLVIGNIETPAELGRYGAAYTLANLLVLASSPLMLPVYRRYMKASLEKDEASIAADTRLFHRYLSLALIPFAVYLGVMGVPVLEILGGDDFRISAVLPALLVAGLFLDQWNGLAHYLLVSGDRTFLLQNLWLACGFMNIAVNLVVVPVYGIEGAAGVTLLSFVLLEGAVFYAASRRAPLWRLYRWDSSVRAAIAGAVAGAAAWAVEREIESGAGALPLATLAFGAVFLVLIVLMREIHRQDVGILARAVGLRTGASG